MTLRRALILWIVGCVFFLMGMLWAVSVSDAADDAQEIETLVQTLQAAEAPGKAHGKAGTKHLSDGRCRDPRTKKLIPGCQ